MNVQNVIAPLDNETYDELIQRNAELAAKLEKAEHVINRLLGEIDERDRDMQGREKVLRMMSAANTRRQNEIDEANKKHKQEIERMENDFRGRMIGNMFVAFTAALAAFGAIYVIVRMTLNGWL